MKISICLIAFGLLGLFLGSYFVKYKKSKLNEFSDSLDPQQQIIYSKIVKERRNIFIFSLIIASFISGATTYLLLVNKNYKTNKSDLICYFISTFLFITYISYILWPKSKYILSYLNNNHQIEGWLNVYKAFRNGNYLGLLLGLLVFIVISRFKYIKRYK